MVLGYAKHVTILQVMVCMYVRILCTVVVLDNMSKYGCDTFFAYQVCIVYYIRYCKYL